jgi:hypothetical protein
MARDASMIAESQYESWNRWRVSRADAVLDALRRQSSRYRREP